MVYDWQTFPIMVLGNKADLVERRQVYEAEAREWCLL